MIKKELMSSVVTRRTRHLNMYGVPGQHTLKKHKENIKNRHGKHGCKVPQRVTTHYAYEQ